MRCHVHPDFSGKHFWGVAVSRCALRDIVENDEFISKCQQGICPIYAAFDKGKMIGISDEQEIDGIRFTLMKYTI